MIDEKYIVSAICIFSFDISIDFCNPVLVGL